MKTLVNPSRLKVRAARAAALCLVALAAVLFQASEARAQFTTTGTNTTTPNNVGVGTTTPAAKLHVVGADGANDYTAAPAPDTLFVMGGKGGNGNWGASAGGIGGALKLQGGKGGSPVAGSSVTGFGGLGGAVYITGGTGGDNTFNTKAGNGGSVFINGGDVGTAPAGGAVVGHVILANVRGSVGVGTTTPNANYKLDVNGQVHSTAGFVFPDGTVQSTAAVSGTTASNLAASQVSAGHFGANVGGGTFSFGSNVGVGTASPGVRLSVNGTGVNVYNTDAWIENNMHVQGNEAMTQGGGRGRMRIGTAWGYMGLYAETSSAGAANDLVLGAGSGTVRVGPGLASTAQHFIVPNGNVGIGTAAPSSARLHVQSPGNTYLRIGAPLANQSAIAFNNDTNGQDIVLYRPENTRDFSIWTAGASNVVRVTQAGNVGIGTTTPSAKLDVVGNLNATGTITGGVINAKYQDVAEWVPSTQKLAAGTVVILDPERNNQVLASKGSYDTSVAGVISAQPGLALGEAGEGKVLVATTGRVKVKVDATKAPIKIGDLLVTSDVQGVAMKSEPMMMNGRKFHSPGTIVGKALEPLASGTGEILVLLSLQ